MTDLPMPYRRNPASRAIGAAIAVLALTSVHHIHGALAFETPWRLHVLAIAVPVGLVLYLGHRASTRMDGTTAGQTITVLAALVILVVPVGMFGFYEGGYNHVVKNLVYFIGGEEHATVLFPPPFYELPRDVFFEATGVAQFPLSIATALLTFRLFRGAER